MSEAKKYINPESINETFERFGIETGGVGMDKKAEKKAKELIEKFSNAYGIRTHPATSELAKQCALIHCDGVIEVLKTMDWTDDLINEWQQIKQQINHE